ncbi:translation initiation factor IF-2-like [Schistocerca piceifrons]|uniref:translation initiation factor IF-2-like n=1 Tax=Schistocerca piceifrons TaxID=274613 RepID=UPI001F5F4295|nr:translation initiation factor IF-2-like [Schistocerca piceifrons]
MAPTSVGAVLGGAKRVPTARQSPASVGSNALLPRHPGDVCRKADRGEKSGCVVAGAAHRPTERPDVSPPPEAVQPAPSAPADGPVPDQTPVVAVPPAASDVPAMASDVVAVEQMEVVLPTPPIPADDAKSPRRRHRRKKANPDQPAEEADGLRPPESGSEADSQASSVSRSVSADRSGGMRQTARQLEALISSSRDRGAIPAKRKHDQGSDQPMQRTRTLSHPTVSDASAPPGLAYPADGGGLNWADDEGDDMRD